MSKGISPVVIDRVVVVVLVEDDSLGEQALEHLDNRRFAGTGAATDAEHGKLHFQARSLRKFLNGV